MKYKNKLTLERLKQVLHYDPKTGLFTWIYQASNRIKIGTLAGVLRNNGYLKISIDKEMYFCHRLAWLYMTGEWPKEDIDHINGIKDDNKFLNLREATRSENNRNRANYGKKVSVSKGVYKYRGKFAVRICLGTYETEAEAIKISKEFYSTFHKQFLHSSLAKI